MRFTHTIKLSKQVVQRRIEKIYLYIRFISSLVGKILNTVRHIEEVSYKEVVEEEEEEGEKIDISHHLAAL